MFIVVIAAEILWLWGHFHCSEDLQLLKHFDLFVSVTPAFAQTQTPILYPQRRPRAISCHMACSQALDWACKLFSYKTVQDARFLEPVSQLWYMEQGPVWKEAVHPLSD